MDWRQLAKASLFFLTLPVSLPLRWWQVRRQRRIDERKKELVKLIERCLEQREAVGCQAMRDHILIFICTCGRMESAVVNSLPPGMWEALTKHLRQIRNNGETAPSS